MDVTEIGDWDGPAWDEVLAAAAGDAAAPARAGALWPIYGPLLAPTTERPFVLGQIGQSLDGRVATANGHSHTINGPQALTHLHRLRALVDAVVVGVGTALADDPQLTVRHADGPHPARVVIDPNGRLPAHARCLRDDGVRRIVLRTAAQADAEGIEQVVVPGRNGVMAPARVLDVLCEFGFRRILIEGGPRTLSHFVAAGLVDRLHVMIAPMIIGSGPAGMQLPPIAHLDASIRPAMRAFRLGDGDILCDCALRP
jgi:riboflavin-specific deaminase-like protein